MCRFLIIMGTRPEAIKIAPLWRELKGRGVQVDILWTNQHYSPNMSSEFFDSEYTPTYWDKTEFGGCSLDAMRVKVRSYDYVVVYGDTNSSLAGAIAAKWERKKLIHIEAGIRSGDYKMIEEWNRIGIDALADELFIPVSGQEQNLLGVVGRKYVTGNLIVDAVNGVRAVVPDSSTGTYIYVTLHRAENVDDEGRLRGLLNAISKLASEFGATAILLVHPRTQKMLTAFSIALPNNIHPRDPVGFEESVRLQRSALFVMTDSGGIQEEACIIGTPCVTLRDNTERPETVEAGMNVIAGIDETQVYLRAQEFLKNFKREAHAGHPYGHNVAVRMADIMEELV